MPSRLQLIQADYPKVRRLVKATEPLVLDIRKLDIAKAERKSAEQCAAALCCRRQLGADGVKIYISRVYVIKGDTAVMYNTPPSLSREIVAFDRGAAFLPGKYGLGVPRRSEGKHKRPYRKSIHKHAPHFVTGVLHHTGDIREAWS